MKLWIKIITGAIPATAAAVILAIILLLRRRRRQRQQKLISPQTSTVFSNTTGKFKIDNIQNGMNKTHLPYKSGGSARNSLRFHHLHHQPPASLQPQPPAAAAFRWDDHPNLITEAGENGWPSFSFVNSIADRPQPLGPLWALFPAFDVGAQQDSPETGFDFPNRSSQLMQSVRLNPSSNKTADNLSSFSSVRTSLPLPGPAIAGGSFPQEAYFEITIVSLNQLLSTVSSRDMDKYSDRSKLIRENSNDASSATQSVNFAAAEGRRFDNLAIALGLTSRVSPSSQSMPGTYPGSIAFLSDGSLYLDGTKMVLESEKVEWAAVNKVIGCGFEPSKKKVFFTVDCQLSHVMRCPSEEYTCPLFPVLSSNVEVSILVNMGQTPFKYAPANAARTPNPRFLQLVAGEEGGEREVGSVESRVETECTGRERRTKEGTSNGSLDDVLDGESDLFEISLQW